MSGILEKLHLKHAQTGTNTGTTGSTGTTGAHYNQPISQGSQSFGQYQGLNFPYSGAAAHPTYGYQRLPHNRKAERFDLKAAEWEKRGNMTKSQKNREKANRYRMRTQPGYVKPVRPQNYYNERANLFDQKAQRYQQWGMAPQAQRYQMRSQRLRTKHNLTGMSQSNYSQTTVNQPIVHQTTHVVAPIVQETIRNDRIVEVQPVVHREVDKNVVHHIEKHYSEVAPSQAGMMERAPIVQQEIHTNVVNEIQPIIHRERVVPVVERTEQHLTQHIVQPTIHTHEVVYERGPYIQQQGTMMQGGLQQQSFGQQSFGQYQGLNFPYTNYGATAHPTYGYQRIPHNRKAERFEAKAAEWERKGNMAKAQKNREKANRYRSRSQPGYVAQARPQTYYSDRANLFDQKAQRYQQWGMAPQAQRYQQRSQRLRTKHSLPLYSQGGLQQGGLQQGIQQPLYSQGGLQQGGLQQGLQGLQQGGLQQGGLQQGGLQQGLQQAALQQGLQHAGLQQGGLQQGGLQQGGLQQGGLQQGGLQQGGIQQGLQQAALQQGLQHAGLQQGGLQQGLQQGGLQQGGLQQGGIQQGLQQAALQQGLQHAGLQQGGLQQGGLQQGLQQGGLQQGLQQGGLQQGGIQGALQQGLQGLNQDQLLKQQQQQQQGQNYTSAR